MSDNQSSNQVPRATTGAVTTPVMTTCADISNSGDSGATAGGSAPANVDDVVYDLRQERAEPWIRNRICQYQWKNDNQRSVGLCKGND